jgi:hypothetical protein
MDYHPATGKAIADYFQKHQFLLEAKMRGL